MQFLITLILLIGLIFWLRHKFISKFMHYSYTNSRHRNSSVDITEESTIACPKCGAYYIGSPNFCPNCGASLKED